MNKQCHRIVFNRRRGQLMAVAECATAHGSGGDGSTRSRSRGSLATAVSLAFGLGSLIGPNVSSAQIAADKSAPGQQRPTVLTAPNNVALVNIQTPSAAGVSRNSYSQFDVQKNGAILNNSRANVQTQLGGWVQGNPWLATGSARLIVNEVNSNAASQLQGYIEVAGQKADLVIANPSGLVVNGAGFINAGGVTLTTGTPQYGSAGSLTGYQVRQGSIVVNGAGLDASSTDYARLLARAIELNAGVWAPQIQAITGSNDIAADLDSRPAPAAADPGTAPRFALDVSALGGMYAGKIVLIGTELGLGVNNAGTLSATDRGGLTLSTSGWLANSGTVASSGADQDLSIQARGVANSGTLSSQHDLQLHDTSTAGAPDTGTVNSGQITAARQVLAQADQFDNRGTITAPRLELSARRLGNSGKLEQTGGQDLQIQADQLGNVGVDARIGTPPSVAVIPPTPGTPDTPDAPVAAVPPSTAAGGGQLVAVGAPAPVEVLAPGRISASQLDNTGRIAANGATDLATTQGLTNSGLLQLRSLDAAGSVDNSQGTIQVQHWQGQQDQIVNRGGSLSSSSSLNLKARGLDNAGGQIASAADVSIELSAGLDNRAGVLSAAAAMTLSSGDANNGGGVFVSGGPMQLALARLDNTAGLVQSAGPLTAVLAQDLDNRGGKLYGDAGVAISSASLRNDDQGRIAATAGAVRIQTGLLSNRGGSVGATGATTITSQALDNTQGSVSGSELVLNTQGQALGNDGGELIATAGALSVNAGRLSNAAGLLQAATDLNLRTQSTGGAQGTYLSGGTLALSAQHAVDGSNGSDGSLDLAGAHLQARQLILEAGDTISTQAAQLSATDTLHLQARQLDNTAGALVAQVLDLKTQALNNSHGQIVQTGTTDLAITPAQSLDNTAGTLATGGNLSLDTQTLVNQAGAIQAGGALGVKTSTLDNRRGQLTGNQSLTVTAGAVDNAGGELGSSAGAATLALGSLANGLVHDDAGAHAGLLSSHGALQLSVSGAVSNAGTIGSDTRLQLAAGSLDNTGTLQSGGALDAQVSGAARNIGGRIVAQGNASLAAASLAQDQGAVLSSGGTLQISTRADIANNGGSAIQSLGDMSVRAQNVDNAAGSLATNGSLALTALAADARSGTLNNHAGSIQAQGALLLDGARFDNSAGSLIAGQSLQLVASDAAARNSNAAGRIVATGPLTMQAGALDNSAGQLGSSADTTTLALTSLDNGAAGFISSHGDLKLSTTGAISNAGTISGDADTRITAASLSNAGALQSAGNLNAEIAGAATNTAGQIVAGRDLTLTAASVAQGQQALLAGGGAVSLTAPGAIANHGGSAIQAQGALTLSSTDLDNAGGQLDANGALMLTHTGSLGNQGGRIQTLDAATLRAGRLDNTAGLIATGAGLDLNSVSVTNTRGRIVATGPLHVNSGALDNSGGQLGSTASTVTLQLDSLNNGTAADESGHTVSGTVSSQLDLTITGSANIGTQVANTGLIASNARLVLNAADLRNAGQIQSVGDASLTVAGSLDNDGGTVQSLGALTVHAGALSNRQGRLLAGNAVAIDAGDLDNSGGEISGSAGNVALHVQALTNDVSAGKVGLIYAQAGTQSGASGGDLAITATTVHNAGNIGAQGQLTLTASQLANSGLLQGDQAVALNIGGTLANQGGALTAGSALTIAAQDIQQSLGARMLAGGNIDLQVAQALDNDASQIAASGNLNLTATRFKQTGTASTVGNGDVTLNLSGELANGAGSSLGSQGQVQLNAASLTNQGNIVGLGRLQAQVDGMLNDRGGQIQAHDLTLQAAAIANAGGTVSAVGTADLAVTGTLDNSAGRIVAGNALTTRSAVLSNSAGLLAATGTVSITATQLDNTAGVLSSDTGALQATVSQGLTNNQGQIYAAKDATLAVGSLTGNAQGRIASDAQLSLQSLGAVDTRQGLLQSRGDLVLGATTLNVDQGAVLAGQALRVTAVDVNAGAGALQATGSLTMQAQGVSVGSGGSVVSDGAMKIDTATLGNAGSVGTRASAAPADVHLQATQLSNTGVLQSAGALVLGGLNGSTDLALTNSAGQIVAATDLSIEASSVAQDRAASLQAGGRLDLTLGGVLNNTDRSSIVAQRDLSLVAKAVSNTQGGRIASDGALSATVTTLDNNTGSLTSRSDMDLQVGDALSNVGGGIQSLAQTRVQAASLDNTGGQILGDTGLKIDVNIGGSASTSLDRLGNAGGVLASRNGAVAVQVAGDIDNSAGTITGTSTQIHAAGIDNRGGGIGASASALDLVASASISNAGGQLVGSGPVTLHAAGLDNSAGTIASTTSSLQLTSSRPVVNDAGSLLAATSLELSGSAVSNQASGGVAGVIRAGDVSIVTGALNNQGGVIAAMGTNASAHSQGSGSLSLTAGSVDNHNTGLMQASGDIALQADSLDNSGTTGNRDGLVAGGNLAATIAGGVNNQAGYIGAGNGLALSVGQDLANAGGTLLNQGGAAHGAVISAARIDNSGGSIGSHGDLVLSATGLVENAGGRIVTDAQLTLKADTLHNTASGTTPGTIDALDARIDARQIDNSGGAITAGHDLAINAAEAVKNANGLLQAANALTLTAPSFDNTGGRVIANKQLSVTTQSQQLGGSLSSGSDLTLNLAGDYTNDAVLTAQRSLALSAANITNHGTLHANENLVLTTPGAIVNTGELSAGGNTTLTAQSISNSGPGAIIDASNGTTTLNAGTISNSASIYGNDVLVRASTSLSNSGAASLMARQDMWLAAPTISNTGGALIYADRNLVVGDSATIGSQALTNSASRIEAGGNISFDGVAIQNLNVGLQTSTTTSTQNVDLTLVHSTFGAVPDLCGQTWCSSTELGFANRSFWNDHRIYGWVKDSTRYPIAVFGANFDNTVIIDLAAYCPSEGNCPNVYLVDRSDPIWAKYGVAPPTTDAEADAQYDALSNAITAFNLDLDSRATHAWIERHVTQEEVTATTITDPGQAGEILAGGTIALNHGTSVLNSSSRIVAGGALVGDAGAITNVGVQGSQTVTEQGQQRTGQTTFGGGGSNLGLSYGSWAAYSEAPVTTTTTLSSYEVITNANQAVNRNVGSGSATGSSAAAGAAASAGGTLQAQHDDGRQAQTQGGAGAQLGGASSTNPGALGTQSQETVAGTGVSISDAALTGAAGPGASGLASSSSHVGTGGQSSSIQGGAAGATAVAVTSATARGNASAVNPSSQNAASVDGSGAASAVAQAAANTRPVITVQPQAPQEGQAHSVVLSTAPSMQLPANSVFSIHAAPGSNYLVETDPRFTNYRSFLSSDYMLAQLSTNPDTILKRLGDGYYEQRLIGDQILALTGQRFLGGYGDAQSEYQALMAAGVTFAKSYHLTPGVSLTPEQMATLTTDIVWLTTQTVTLADGSTQQVLVPQVYLRRTDAGDLQASGALIAAGSIALKSSSDIVNDNATIQAAGSMSLVAANNLTNQGGQLRGQDVMLSAERDLNNIGGSITATGDGNADNGLLIMNAGRDILLQTTTQSSANTFGTRTNVDRVATVQGGDVSLAAARDLLVQGAQLSANGSGATLVASAGGDLRVTAVQTASTFNASLGGSGGVNNRGSYFQESTQTLTGSSLHSDGNATLMAGKQLDLTASQLTAVGSVALTGANVSIEAGINSQASDAQVLKRGGYNQLALSSQTLTGGTVQAGTGLIVSATGKDGDLKLSGANLATTTGATVLSATRDVTITSLATSETMQSASKSTSSGLLSSKTTTTQSSSSATTQNASTVGGETVAISAGRDITVAGSQVVSDQGTALTAGRDVNIISTVNNQTEHTQSQTTKSGLLGGGGIGVTIGTRDLKQTTDHAGDTAAASTVASIGGNVSISAGRNYEQVGSNVLTPQGNIDVTAQFIAVTEAREKASTTSSTEFHQSGLSLALSAPGIGSAMNAQAAAKMAEQAEDPRMKALAVATAAAQAIDAAKELGAAAQAASQGQNSGVSVSISIGSSQATSKQTQTSDAGAASSLSAGGNIRLNATGAAENSNITVRGSDLQAGGNIQLKADNQVNLLAVADKSEQHSSNQSSSASVGLSIGIGQGQTTGIFASASLARGNQDGSDQSQRNTHVSANDTVSIVSGGDTTLKGAVVSGQQVTGDIGGNLNIQSLQDTAKFDSKSQSASGTVAYQGASVSASVSLAQTKVSADYLSVGEQSGIKAGDNGFQLNVKGNTALDGSVISSSQTAVDAHRNTLTTGTLSSSDLQNHSQYDAQSISVTVGTNGGSAGAFQSSGNMQSTTKAGLGGADVTLTKADATSQQTLGKLDRSVTGQSTGSGIKQNWNGQKLAEQTQLSAQVVQAFGAEASKVAAQQLDAKRDELQKNADNTTDLVQKQALLDEVQKYDEGGAYRVAAHAVIGGLSGGVGGAVGAATSASLAPDLNKLQNKLELSLLSAGLSDEAAHSIAQLTAGGAATLAGGISGAVNGASASLNQDFNNRQLEPSELSLGTKLSAKSNGQFTEAQINNALRLADYYDSNGQLHRGSDTLAKLNSNSTYDYPPPTDFAAGSSWTPKPDDGVLVQNLPASISPALAYFIRKNTGGDNSRYSWDQRVLATVTPTSSSDDLAPAPVGTQRVPVQVGGTAYYPLVADCPAAACQTGSPIAAALGDPATTAYLKALEKQQEKELTIAGTLLDIGKIGVDALAGGAKLVTGSGAATEATTTLTSSVPRTVDNLPNVDTIVYTEAQARNLSGENRGLIYVTDPLRGSEVAQDFQAGTTGAFSDLATGKNAVPALRYDNSNLNGVNYVKFDGAEAGADGSTVLLIDAKTKMAIFNNGASRDTLVSLNRVKAAVEQNPGYTVMYEFPNQAAADAAATFIRDNGFAKFVKTRVRTGP
ncbi:hemagglutinin repeat-containing protein [Paucibacter sp. R3-3]|uniref:Hemagglutinin repeat-containing protein n=1 Tax=Roseateles agri TaxID=3098619 RepID=A0ABU5DHU3_9BURK|nr:hemagglutinin repeat-containing protein [Paucibacter sp. R3-3]MDY0745366.1 hemagglutinin repeat-containing protein [Paucibacter sp. R3-3]